MKNQELKLDLATTSGLFFSFFLVFIAIFLGSSMRSFFDISSVLIVIFGTFFVTLASYSFFDFISIGSIMKLAFISPTYNFKEDATFLLDLSQKSRKDGLLSLQDQFEEFKVMPFFHKGISMVVDGLAVDEIERILVADISSTLSSYEKSVGMLRRAADVAPAMGLIGTLIGLVQMLSNLEDPSVIGPSMAVALLTTFYGAILANMLFTPMAEKLERHLEKKSMQYELFIMGIMSIGRQENPRRLEMLINSFLPEQYRVQYFEE